MKSNPLKPFFNYDISVTDRPNQITNPHGHGIVRMIFAASESHLDIVRMLDILEIEGFCNVRPLGIIDNRGMDQDLYYEVEVASYEDYNDFCSEMIGYWIMTPLSIAYTPSREEVGL